MEKGTTTGDILIGDGSTANPGLLFARLSGYGFSTHLVINGQLPLITAPVTLPNLVLFDILTPLSRFHGIDVEELH